MKKSTIVIEVRGGVVVAVYSNDSRSRVLLLDWDERPDRFPYGRVEATRYPVDRFAAMPADTAELALKAAND
jgi:carbamoylphosphate synthase large subunit